MPVSSLYQIERTFASLWTNRKARGQFLHMTCSQEADASNYGLPDKLLTGIDKAGVRLYAALMNYGHQDVMLSIFPGCAFLLGQRWQDVVHDYLEHYQPNHYCLNQVGLRFSQYLRQQGKEFLEEFPFICELADYEWLELELLEKETETTTLSQTTLTTPA